MTTEIPAITALLSRAEFRDCSLSLYLNDEMFWSAYISRAGAEDPVAYDGDPLYEEDRTVDGAIARLEAFVYSVI